MEILLLLAVLAAAGLGVALLLQRQAARSAASRHQLEIHEWSSTNARLEAATKSLEAEVASLVQYRAIRDAQAEAARILSEAGHQAERIVREAELRQSEAERQAADRLAQVQGEASALRAKARDDAERLRRKATEGLEEAQQRADSIIRSAQQEALQVLDRAKAEAQRVAGSAFEALENASRYEKVAEAMKNLIEGYGDRYIIPSHSVLDDLAEEYGFAQAGEELKNARERTRQMVKQSTAATCEYVETSRRETAIRFVIDAFNGRVDSILSRAKHDNIGTLRKEIEDAFQLVNHNGAAFRAARILPTYLEARLTELRWAVAAQELKLRDQEEQRRIREQIREEEKAQREFERSMRQAAKEEDTMRKAMEKIQAQVAKASDEQRAKFEAQLAELTAKLREAEERNQRALSMAQQTKSGHVYVISNVGSFGEEVFKIGMTRRLEPLDRIRELGDASVPFPFDVHALIYSEDSPALENALHKRFLTAQVNKVNPRKEFFRLPIHALRQTLDQMGVQATWTLAAEAREYRETLAIEKTLRENPEKAREWLEWQSTLEFAEPLEEEVDAA